MLPLVLRETKENGMAKLTGKTYNIANLRAAMEDDNTGVVERRRAATKLYELGALSEMDFKQFLPRPANGRTLTGSKANKP